MLIIYDARRHYCFQSNVTQKGKDRTSRFVWWYYILSCRVAWVDTNRCMYKYIPSLTLIIDGPSFSPSFCTFLLLFCIWLAFSVLTSQNPNANSLSHDCYGIAKYWYKIRFRSDPRVSSPAVVATTAYFFFRPSLLSFLPSLLSLSSSHRQSSLELTVTSGT